MRKLLIPFLFITIFVFVACSHKNYYTPKKINKTLSYRLDLKSEVKSLNRDGLTYMDGSVISSKRGMLEYKIPKGYHFLYDSKRSILIADDSGEAKVIQNGKVIFKNHFDTAIASGAIDGNLLALVLANNKIILYDMSLQRELFSEALEPTFAQDARIANPIFVKNLIIFPTLDGRLLVVDKGSYLIVKDIALSDKELFNNIIYLEEKRGVIVAATRYKVISVTNHSLLKKRYPIKDIAFDGKSIYIFTNGGRVIKSDIYLKTEKEIKFDFANFVAVSLYDRVYAVLKNGYLLKIDKNLGSYEVLRLPSEIDRPAFIFKNKLFIGSNFIDIR